MSVEEDTNNTWGSTRCKKFSGVYTEYNEWKTKFITLAKIKGYAKYYKTDIGVITREENNTGLKAGTTTAVTDAEKKEYANKVKAWAFLIMHLTGTAFNLVNQHNTNTYKGMEALDDKYKVSKQGVTELLKEVTTQW